MKQDLPFYVNGVGGVNISHCVLHHYKDYIIIEKSIKLKEVDVNVPL
jgi:hypothetical protein